MSRLIITALALLLAGCGTHYNERSISLDEMRSMRPDCTNSDIQIRWLTRQLELGGYNVEREERTEAEYQYIAQAKEKIWTLRSSCFKSLQSR